MRGGEGERVKSIITHHRHTIGRREIETEIEVGGGDGGERRGGKSTISHYIDAQQGGSKGEL